MAPNLARRNWRGWLLGATAAAGIAVACALDPIPQDPAYHEFADRRAFFGVPNFWSVASNLPFVAVGLFGLAARARLRRPELRTEYLTYCAGTILVGFGSGSYHFAPSTRALVWDRLPMTIAFMALFATALRDRLGAQLPRGLAKRLLLPLLAAGVASIAYWSATEAVGRGDLRPYGLVQFLPMLLIPLILLLFDGDGLDSRWLWWSLTAYAAAKFFEQLDGEILDWIGAISGHSLKHVAAAVGALWAVRAALLPPSVARDRGHLG